MQPEQFTSQEGSQGTAGSVGLIIRFLRYVPVLRWGIAPTCLLSLFTAAAHQGFIWLSAKLAECSSTMSCAAHVLIWDISVTPTFSLLVWLAVIALCARVVQWTLFESVGQLGCRNLLRLMVQGVGKTRTTFFDEYPSGKIINRFVKDADSLRFYGPIRIGDSINSLIELVIVAAVISFASPYVALLVAPTLLLFLYVQRNVAPMLQHLMVLRSARFGEVLHRETDVIEGGKTFISYGQFEALMRRLAEAAHRYMQMHFLRGTIENSGRLWCDIGVAIYASVILAAVYVGIHVGSISTVVGALIITAAFRLDTVFRWLTWSLGQVFETAGHARRVFEYVDLPPEEAEEGNTPIGSPVPPPLNNSALSITSYSMSYRRNTPMIIKNLSLVIPSGQRVGLVGRTGAGKSSFVQALFRMVHVHSGDIRVGDSSIFLMPLAQARSLFAVVPQDPYLFEGTVRSNIDRGAEYSDDQLHDALSLVKLSLGLDAPVVEGGSNLSLGQRQLLCLARVIISKRPIVVMDEPTSGVDTITDATIQEVLQTALGDRTIITIAHRLETLLRQDRIIELEEGVIVRDGSASQVIPQLTQAELG